MNEDTRLQLTKLADEMKPEFDKIVDRLGPEQVRANIMNGVRRMHDRALAEGRPSGAAAAAAHFGIRLDD